MGKHWLCKDEVGTDMGMRGITHTAPTEQGGHECEEEDVGTHGPTAIRQDVCRSTHGRSELCNEWRACKSEHIGIVKRPTADCKDVE